MTERIKALKLIFSVSRFLGFAPFCIKDTGHLEASRLFIIYSYIPFLSALIFGGYSFFRKINEIEKEELMIACTNVMAFISMFAHVSSFIRSIRCRQTIVQTVHQLLLIDSLTKENENVKLFKKNIYKLLLAVVILGIPKIGLINLLGIRLLITELICTFGDYVVILQFSFLVSLSREYLTYLNLEILEMYEKSKESVKQSNSVEYVFLKSNFGYAKSTKSANTSGGVRFWALDVVNKHHRICDVLLNVNRAFSLQILLNIAKFFTYLTYSSYFLVTITFSQEFPPSYRLYIVHFVHLFVSGVFQLLMIVVVCFTTVEEVSLSNYKLLIAMLINCRIAHN